jgi:hypothetical protein
VMSPDDGNEKETTDKEHSQKQQENDENLREVRSK